MVLLSFSSWWENMGGLEQIYWVIAAIGTLVLVLFLFLMIFGGDADDAGGDADAEVDGDTGIPFQFFTIKNLSAFLLRQDGLVWHAFTQT